MFSNLKISSKLSLMVALLLALTIGVAGYGMLALKQAQGTTAASLKMSANLLLAVDSARAAEVSFKVQVQEFKNILLRGHDQKDFDRYLAAFRKRSEMVGGEFQDVQDAFGKLGLPLDVVADARRLHADIVQQYTDGLRRFEIGKVETSGLVDASVRGKDRPLEEKIEAVVTAAEKFAEKEGARLTAEAAAETTQAVTVLTIAIVLGMVAAIFVAAMVIRSLSRELGGEPAYAKEVARRIAAGDLSLDVQVRSGDRDSMVFAMKQMADNLRSLVGEVAGGAHTVSDTSAQIAQGNTDLSQRTEEQASTLEETASQMEELTTTVTQNAENARQASQLAVTASDVARKGGDVVGEVVQTMNGISNSSRRISDIIGVIDGIAFQTNILALNAAVEAARAGDQGRGFAVVATEVRNLAQRSAAAAKEIKGLIGDSVSKVEAGTRLVDAAGQTMTEIVASVKRVSDLISEIAAASREQSAGIEQVNTAVTQMDQVVQQNASLVEEAAAATESMKTQARQLLGMVARFRLRDSTANGEFGPPADAGTAGPAAAAAPQPIRVKPAPQRLQAAPAFALASAKPAGANGAWREF